MKAAARLNRIRKVMKEKGLSAKKLHYIVCDFNESAEDAIARSGYDPDDDFVVIVKFAVKPTWPGHKKSSPKNEVGTPHRDAATLDAEIQKLKAELKQDGLSERQIAELMTEEPMTETLPPDDTEPEPEEDDLLKVEPMRADLFLTGMSR